MDKHPDSPFTKGVILALVLLYGVGGVLLFIQVGSWEVVRYVGINGLIVATWLWSAVRILGAAPVPEAVPIRRPGPELAWLLAVLTITVGLSAVGYGGWVKLPSGTVQAVMYGGVLVLLIGWRYPLRILGVTWPGKRGWAALAIVVLINVAAAALFQILPQDEPVTSSPGDLAQQITGPASVLVLLVSVLFRAALPEELLLRVAIQPRLAQWLPLGWAIVTQALLFSLGHLPQKLLGYGELLPLALAYTLLLDNGLIAGYLWHRTRSLPLLVVLHLFAFPRFGI